MADREDAFASEHGSWDCALLSDDAMMFVRFKQGKLVGPPQVVVSGFYSNNEKKLYGVPVTLAQHQQGARFIADGVVGAAWRVTI